MRILVVGLGSIGKSHIKAILSICPDSKIFALRSKENSDDYLNVSNIYRIDEIPLLALDFVIISNPTSEHKKTLELLVKYNLPMFIEKPIYYSLDIENIVNKLTNIGAKTYIACNLRFLDSIRFIKNNLSLLLTKRLNEVNVYCGSYLPNWRPNTDFRKSYSTIAELGGGVHLDLIHELDYLYWIFGKPNRVKGEFRSESSLSVPVFDYANYLLDYDSFSVSIVLNYFRRDAKRSFELVFDDETWYIDLLKNQITSNNQILFTSEQRISDTYKMQMEYFIECLRSEKNTFNNVADAFNVLKICLANDLKR